MELDLNFFADSTTSKQCTIIPMIMQDEGLGDPASYNAHREHASFAAYAGPNCYPDSFVPKIDANLTLALSKACINTDKVDKLNVMVMPIFMAFKDDYEAIDDLSSIEVQDVLEMQKEATDKQGYPVWNGTAQGGDNYVVGTDVPGLTAGQLQSVTFDLNQFYDAMQFLTISGKLRKCCGKPRWYTVSRYKNVNINLRSFVNPKVKKMNPYTFCGLLIYVPKESQHQQLVTNSDLSDTYHIHAIFNCRYDEWNENFDSTKV